MTTAYPFDPTGTSSGNRIGTEQHVLTAQNFRDFQYVIPKFAPFFENNFVISLRLPNGTVRPLTLGVDYYFSNQFIDASKACAKPLYGSISFLDTDTYGILTLDYNTVGDIWTLSADEILRILGEEMRNPRITSWEQITNVPKRFPVVDHVWDLIDMVGEKEVVASLDRIQEALLATSDASIATHVADLANPHQTNKTQVGLGSVENFPIATQVQALDGTSNTAYMTPLRVVSAINTFGGALVAAHASDKANPHQTTKAQVGLGSVDNYVTANQSQAEAGSSNSLFMTPLRVAQAITAQTGLAFASHIANTQNPHDTTKEQVGLSNIQNYPVATQEEARAGTASDRYMTPLRTRQLVTEYVSTELDSHAGRTDNPHNTTAAQVGLGLVLNYAMANQAEAEAGILANRYMSPLQTRQAIISYVTVSLDGHASRTDNPHSTTAAQVGLGLVQNYGVATGSEAVLGTATDRYMTPAVTAEAINDQVGAGFNLHKGDTSNPHQVSKAQVGLGLVLNYPVATQAEAQSGTSNVLYMTPQRTKDAITAQIGTTLADHTNRIDNPHGVTKAQVGLGSVQNYPVAAVAEAQAGNSNSLYMTPLRVKDAITYQVGTLVTDHTQRVDNPHQVTKAQVGLGSVSNYPVATQAEAQVGVISTAYMTPSLVKDAITAQIGTSLADHTVRVDNPHAVTKTQVGLGSVSNYPVATQQEAKDGLVSTAYMTPLRTKEAINEQVTVSIIAHTGDTGNPHQVSKAQVGLGSVQNYGIAAIADAQDGTSNTLYMTPLRVKEAIALQVAETTSHVTDLGNPHQVTATQIGLGSVQDYAVATLAEAQAGTVSDRYMTPLRTQQQMAVYVNAVLDIHTTNISNPHQVTKAQVGLGSVADYSIATQADAEAAISNAMYMTPQLTRNTITALAAPISHITNYSNPHQTTATQVGAYTKVEVGMLLGDYVAKTDTWVSGQTRSDFVAFVRSGESASALSIGGMPLSVLLKNNASSVQMTSYDVSNTIDPAVTPFRWLEVGTVSAPTNAELGDVNAISFNHPDAFWFLTGGHKQEVTEADNALAASAGYLVHAKNGGDPDKHSFDVTRLSGGVDSDVQFGYSIGVDGLMHVWLKVAYGFNGISATHMAKLGSTMVLTDKTIVVEPTGIVYKTPISYTTATDFTAALDRITALETTVNSVTVV